MDKHYRQISLFHYFSVIILCGSLFLYCSCASEDSNSSKKESQNTSPKSNHLTADTPFPTSPKPTTSSVDTNSSKETRIATKQIPIDKDDMKPRKVKPVTSKKEEPANTAASSNSDKKETSTSKSNAPLVSQIQSKFDQYHQLKKHQERSQFMETFVKQHFIPDCSVTVTNTGEEFSSILDYLLQISITKPSITVKDVATNQAEKITSLEVVQN